MKVNACMLKAQMILETLLYAGAGGERGIFLNGGTALPHAWCCKTRCFAEEPKCFEIISLEDELTQAGALLSSLRLNKSQTPSLDHIHCTLNCTLLGAPVASRSWNNTKNFIIIHWFLFQHTISFESNGSIKSYLWGQPRYRRMLTCYWWQGGKKLLNTADQYLVSLLQPSADIKYISLQLQK